MNSRSFKIIAVTGCAALVAACATGPRYSEPRYSEGPAPVYTSPPQYANQYAQYGQVSRIDTVPVASRTSGAGAVLGAVLGACVTASGIAAAIGPPLAGAIVDRTGDHHWAIAFAFATGLLGFVAILPLRLGRKV